MDTATLLNECREVSRLTRQQEKQLLQLKDTYPEARDILIEKNLRFVHYVAKKFKGRGIEYEDLISAGTIGLIEGIDSFNTEAGNSLSAYVELFIRGEIVDEICRMGLVVPISKTTLYNIYKLIKAINSYRQKNNSDPSISELSEILKKPENVIKKYLFITSGRASAEFEDISHIQEMNIFSDEEENNPEDIAIKNEKIYALYEALDELNDEDFDLICKLYGLGNTEKMTIKKLSELSEMSKKQIENRKKNILEKLRKNAKLKFIF